LSASLRTVRQPGFVGILWLVDDAYASAVHLATWAVDQQGDDRAAKTNEAQKPSSMPRKFKPLGVKQRLIACMATMPSTTTTGWSSQTK
jgi:hypothetical protein